jgi:repressor LexA
MALLTKRQKEILDFLQSFLEAQGYAPSLSEIAAHFGLSSPATVHEHMKALEEKGFIQRGWNRKRSVTLLSATELAGEEAVELPLLGQIAAGRPIEAVLDDEAVSVPRAMIGPGRHYVLKVKGESMVDEHILDGDLVVVRASEAAENGETVVALMEGANATLKKLYREAGRIRLQPANEAMAPIIVDEAAVVVQGITVGLIRRFG